MKRLALFALLLVHCAPDRKTEPTVSTRTDPLYAVQSKLPASPVTVDDFGSSVAISGSTAAIGSTGGTGAVDGSGAAHVYLRGTNGAWTQQAKLVAPDGAYSDQYGRSIAIDGDTVAVGAPWHDLVANATGSVYVWVRSGTTWTRQTTLSPSTIISAHCGESVALSSNTLLIGCPGDTGKAAVSGTAYVYVRSGTTWTQQAKLMASDGAGAESFGVALALVGDAALIGAPRVGAVAPYGAVYAFARSGSAWTETQRIAPTMVAGQAYFGRSVALSTDTAVIGAPEDQGAEADQGSAHVFVRSGATWVRQAKLTASDGRLEDRFGSSLAIVGDTVVASAPEDDDKGLDSGSAYVFQRAGTTWSQQLKLLASDGAAADLFGGAPVSTSYPATGQVAMNGDTAVIGALRKTNAAGQASAGAAYVFRILPSKANGVACSAAVECASGFCVDGQCCDRACDGTCEGCTAALKGSGSDGTCATVPALTNPRGKCVKDPGYPTSCLAPGVCDGIGIACPSFAAAGLACGATTCTAGTVAGNTCDGAGACSATPKSCGAYKCKDATTCATSCAVDGDCTRSTDVCTSGVCVSRRANGESATATRDCLSGFVADGVCCNSECKGTCEACDLEGTKGTCAPVVGEAKHGACPKGTETEPCAEASCNGITRDACVGFVIGKVCSAPSCKDGTEVFESRCVGNGSCPAPPTRPCEPYVCGAGSCNLSCSADADCVSGYTCDKTTSRCLIRAVCDSDHTLKSPNGVIVECAPYRCVEGACRESCDDSVECTPGRLCDVTSHRCVAATPVETTTEDGGCSMSRAQSAPPWLIAMLMLVVRRSRRPERRPR